jgi:lipopolysaccharide export system protein LptA
MKMRNQALVFGAAAALLAIALDSATPQSGQGAQPGQRPPHTLQSVPQNRDKPAQSEATKRDASTGTTGTAQSGQGPPNALQGFSLNRDKPVHIEAATLEVRDKQKIATFSGNVHLIQGDTDMRCKTLIIYYEDDSSKPAVKAAEPGPGGQQQIKRLEAKGGVVVTQKDQTATGQSGIFDMKDNTVTLLGNVVMSQGQNVLMGERLTVNLTTGVSVVDDGKGGQGRVKGLFQQQQGGPSLPGPGGAGLPAASVPAAKDAPAAAQTSPPKDSPKPAPSRPLRLN